MGVLESHIDEIRALLKKYVVIAKHLSLPALYRHAEWLVDPVHQLTEAYADYACEYEHNFSNLLFLEVDDPVLHAERVVEARYQAHATGINEVLVPDASVRDEETLVLFYNVVIKIVGYDIVFELEGKGVGLVGTV